MYEELLDLGPALRMRRWQLLPANPVLRAAPRDDPGRFTVEWFEGRCSLSAQRIALVLLVACMYITILSSSLEALSASTACHP